MSANRSARIRRLSAVPVLAALTGAVCLLGGCGPEKSEAMAREHDQLRSSQLDSPRAGSAEPEFDAFSQAQRDVEAFLQHRSKNTDPVAFHDNSPHDPQTSPSSDAVNKPGRAKAPPIVWNGTGGTTNVIPAPSTTDSRNRSAVTDTVRARPDDLDATDNALAIQDFPDRIAPREPAPSTAEDDAPARTARTGSAEDSELTERDEPGGGVETLAPTSLDQLVVDLSRELYQKAAYADMPLRELLLIAATSMIDPGRAIEPSAIPGLTERERELLGQFQRFFATLGKELDGSREADEVLTQSLARLREALDQTPPLTIAAAALCTSVRGFGDYTPFSKYVFLAQEQQQAVVYVEMDNFNSRTNEKGDWLTELSQELTIYSDRDGLPVWSEPWQKAVDVSRKQRQDFFTVQIVTLPKALSVGKYYFKIRVRDEQTDALAEHSIPFELVADPRMAVKIP